LQERQRERWTPGDGALQLGQRFIFPADAVERARQQRLELRVRIAPGRALQGGNGVSVAPLQQKRVSEQADGGYVPRG